MFFSPDIILANYLKTFIYQNCFVKVIFTNEVISLVHIFRLLFSSTINFVFFSHSELSLNQ